MTGEVLRGGERAARARARGSGFRGGSRWRVLWEVVAFLAVAAAVVLGFLAGGAFVVFVVVSAGVAVLAWRVAVASRPPRPPGMRRARPRARGYWGSGVLVGHQRDADVVHDESREREGVEDLVEPEPPR